ncbi:MAG: hypothetical protein VB099_16485 [Candidatus Limiplasma sp.]|nr:hypothetical protein [Candidatus Limiplasma sp.]
MALEARGLVDQRFQQSGYTVYRQPTYQISKAGLVYLGERENRIEEHSEHEAKEQAKEHKAERVRVQDARRSWWQFALGLLFGWILGGFTFREFLGLFH